jgi:Zn-dependent M28 family amino/carboxypeptidase
VSATKSVSATNIKRDIKSLVGFGTRVFFTRGADKAGRFIIGKMKGLGYSVSKDPFTFVDGRHRIPAYNVIATKRGSVCPNKTIIISAHYDSTSKSGRPAPGADDNASGVAALFEIARILKGYSPRYTIKFVFFTAEEFGCQGSKHFASKINNGVVKAVFNLDQIGYSNERVKAHEDIDIVANPQSKFISDLILKAKKRFAPSTRTKVTINAKLSGADHGSFWAKWIPAVMVSEDIIPLDKRRNPNMHTPNDTINTLYFPLIIKTTKLILSSLMLMDLN